MPKNKMKLTYEQFLKQMIEGDELTRTFLYDYYSYAYKERERQREKARKQWIKHCEAKKLKKHPQVEQDGS